MSVCIGWATTGFTIRSLSRVFWVMGHMRRRCTDQPTHPSCVYSSKAQYTAEKPIHQQPTNSPCVYNRATAVQQCSRKKQKQKSRDRGIWTNCRLGYLHWRSACPESSALPLSQKEMSWFLAVSGRATLKSRRSPSLAAVQVSLLSDSNHGRILNTC